MTPEHLKKCADILVESGYKMTSTYYDSCAELQHHKEYEVDVHIDPYADTLEGRRQADVIEDWLEKNNFTLLLDSSDNVFVGMEMSNHQWRLDRIRWCIDQIGDDNG